MRFSNKVCMVTGGGSGIGRATCERFATEGAIVVVIDRDETGGNETVSSIQASGGNAQFIKTDIGVAEQIEQCVQQVVGAHGKVDVVVNNAAMMTFTPIVDLDPADWDRVMHVNLRSVFSSQNIACRICRTALL